MITPKQIKDFFATPHGKFIIGIVVVLIIAGALRYFLVPQTTEPKEQISKPKIFPEQETFNTGVAYDKLTQPKEPPPPPQEEKKEQKIEHKQPQQTYTPVVQQRTIQAPPILNIYTKPGTKSLDLAERFAPYGRLVPCQLVITIDSAFAETPIIALVTENIWHAGKLVIPAGTEVHGKAMNKPIRDRVMTEKEWIFVWRTRDEDNGKELRVKGLALTKEEMLAKNSWNILDGSAGIRGEIIQSSDMQKLLAYAADFLATFADNLTQETVTITDWGQTTTKGGNVKDALNEGFASAARKYADKLLQQIENEGYFVRCAAGTVFYLYVTDVVNMNEAEIAGTRIAQNQQR